MAVRVKLHMRGFRQLRNSPGVVADLAKRAAAIAAQAGDGFATRPAETGGDRARVAVVTETAEAMIDEAKHRTLTTSIDAGR